VLKKINRKHIYYAIWITLLFLLTVWLIPVFIPRIVRLYESILLSVNNIWIYLKFVFGGIEPDGIYTSIDLIDNKDITIWETILPVDPYIFLKHIICIFTLPFNGLMLEYWFFNLLQTLLLIARIALIILMIYFLLKIVMTNYYQEQEFIEENVFKESKPKKIFLKILDFLKIPISYIKDFFIFSIEKKIFFKICLVLFLFRINAIHLMIEVFGFLFAFVVSFNFVALWEEICCLVVDLFPVIKFIPPIFYVIVILALLYRKWIKDADEEINHQYSIVRGIVNSVMSTTNFFVGAPGVGKTLLLTQCIIVAESNLRFNLLEGVISDIRREYPEFNFTKFEHQLLKMKEDRKILNWAQAEQYVLTEADRVLSNDEDLFFDYDYKKKKIFHYNELYEQSIFEALSEYAHAYFMYSEPTPLAATSYPIRLDNVYINNGHFINFDDNFINHNNRYMDDFSSFTHINNFDWQRIFKKTSPGEDDSLEDGCILGFTEYAKERLNQLGTKGMSKNDDKANQVNDGTTDWWKTKSHVNTIRNKRYGQAFVDDQREESLNADNREIFENVWKLSNKSDDHNVLRGFWFSRILLQWIYSFTDKHIVSLRSTRSDDTLLIYLLKKLNTFCYTLLQHIENRWTLHFVDMTNQYEQTINMPVIHKLCYSKRYETGLLGNFYKRNLLTATKGFHESPMWSTLLADVEELLSTNSYFYPKFFQYTGKEIKEGEFYYEEEMGL